MKSKISFLITLWSVILCLSLGVLLFGFGKKESRASERENRMLQGMPALTTENLFSGNLSDEMEAYLCDSFFARDYLINSSDRLLGMFSVETVEDTALLEGGDDELQGMVPEEGETPDDPGVTEENIPETDGELPVIDEEPSDDTAEELNADEFGQESEKEPGTSSPKCGFYFRDKDGKLVYCFHTFSERRKLIVQALNKYRELLPEDGNVFYMMVPLTRNYTPIKESPRYVGWFSNTEDAMAELADEGVHIINAPRILEPHLDEEIYFPIDHHWSSLGAYYVCEEIITMQGLPMTPYNEYNYLSKYVTRISAGLKGWFDVMYPLQEVSAKRLYANTEKKAVFMNYDSDTYMAYLGGRTLPWTKYTTGFCTGRKALVIGDSFANVFAPYLCPYYDEIHMTDVRQGYYDAKEAGGWISTLMEKNGIDDVYIIMSYANGANSETSYERLEYCLYGK